MEAQRGREHQSRGGGTSPFEAIQAKINAAAENSRKNNKEFLEIGKAKNESEATTYASTQEKYNSVKL